MCTSWSMGRLRWRRLTIANLQQLLRLELQHKQQQQRKKKHAAPAAGACRAAAVFQAQEELSSGFGQHMSAVCYWGVSWILRLWCKHEHPKRFGFMLVVCDWSLGSKWGLVSPSECHPAWSTMHEGGPGSTSLSTLLCQARHVACVV